MHAIMHIEASCRAAWEAAECCRDCMNCLCACLVRDKLYGMYWSVRGSGRTSLSGMSGSWRNPIRHPITISSIEGSGSGARSPAHTTHGLGSKPNQTLLGLASFQPRATTYHQRRQAVGAETHSSSNLPTIKPFICHLTTPSNYSSTA